MRLRLRLIFLVLIAVLPAIAIQFYTEFDLRRSREQEIHEEALRHARLVTTSMSELINGSRQLLIALAHLPAVRALDPETCSNMLSAVLDELPGYAMLGASDRNGTLVCAGGPDAQAEGPTILDRTYFRDVLLTGGFVIGDFATGQATGTKALHVAHPIIRDGEMVGVLVAGLDLEWLEKHFQRPSSATDAVVDVADRNGTILVRLPEGEQWVGRPLPEDHRAYIFGDWERTAELKDVTGEDRVFAYIPMNYPPAGFAVAVGLDKSQAIARIEWATARGIALILFGLALGCLAAWAVGRYFVRRPVTALLNATWRWQNGDYAARTGLVDDGSEIGHLAQAFDEMAERLQEQLRQKDMLLREVNHRIMNSLQLLSSMLALQRRQIDDPGARDQFEQARRRVQSLALVHRRLYRRDGADTADFGEFLRELCAEITRSFGPSDKPVNVQVDAESIKLSTDRIIPLGLIVFEFLSNAFKYATPEGAERRLKVGCRTESEEALVLQVSDNGPGLPADFEQRAGLGIKLVQTLVAQLRASLTTTTGPTGATFVVSMPLRPPGQRKPT